MGKACGAGDRQRPLEMIGLSMDASIATFGRIVPGTTFVLGFAADPAILALAAFLTGATAISFDFWKHEGADGTARLNGFIANTALIGAVLANWGG